MNQITLDRVNDVSAFASTDPNRKMIGHVNLGATYVEATNGKMLIRAPYADPEFKNDTQTLIPAGDLRDAIAGLKKSKVKNAKLTVEPASVGTEGEKFVKLSDGMIARTVATFSQSEEKASKWPNTDLIWPGESKLSIVISADILLAIAKYATGLDSDAAVKFDLIDEVSAVAWSTRVHGREVRGVLMPMRTT